MYTTEQKINTIMQLMLSEDDAERQNIKNNLRNMMGNTASQPVDNGTDAEGTIRQIMMELGAPDHLLGHDYAVQAILMVMKDRTYIDNIVSVLYPKLAAQFDTTATRGERAIRHLIETAWLRSDTDTIYKYFGNTVSADRGKPTNGEFIARIANEVKLKMKR